MGRKLRLNRTNFFFLLRYWFYRLFSIIFVPYTEILGFRNRNLPVSICNLGTNDHLYGNKTHFCGSKRLVFWYKWLFVRYKRIVSLIEITIFVVRKTHFSDTNDHLCDRKVHFDGPNDHSVIQKVDFYVEMVIFVLQMTIFIVRRDYI